MSEVKATDKAIKFPTHHYVGFQSRPTSDNCPLGFMTPDGTDSAAKKRKESVDKWAEGGHWNRVKDVVPSVSYENKPMVGFKLSRSIRRDSSFGSGNVKWRIEDPRGFELEISSPNFAQILLLCTMEKGEIQEQLIWGRLGSENILVPVESDVYKAAVANTERVSKKVKPSEVKIGDKVIMQNGDEGIFYGYFYMIYSAYSWNKIGQQMGDKKRFLIKITSGGWKDQWQAIGSPKISECIPGDGTLTQELAEQEINAASVASRKKESYGSVVHENGYSSMGYISAVNSLPPKKSDVKVTWIEEDFAVAAKRASGVYFGAMPGQSQNWYAFSMKQYHDTVRHNRGGFDKVWINAYDKDKIEQEGEFVDTQPNRGLYYGYNSNNTGPDRQSHADMPEKVTRYTITVETAHSGQITLVVADE